MKILWFSITNSLYGKNSFFHNGGGWISSLEGVLGNENDIDLAIAFEAQETAKICTNEHGVTYYPFKAKKTAWEKVQEKFGNFSRGDYAVLDECTRIINDFSPDVIHVFGTEWPYGLIQDCISIPVVHHIQGIASAYIDSFFPPKVKPSDLVLGRGLGGNVLGRIQNYRYFKYRAEREKKIMRNGRFFFGRTNWDREAVCVYSPKALYYYCSEMLRPIFYAYSGQWGIKDRDHIVVTSTISSPLYKGGDLILKTAKILSEMGLTVKWNVVGVSNLKFQEDLYGLNANSLGVICKGVLDECCICDMLLDSDVYVHPSYIDNSPNSVCEAQILGVPIVSTNCGGVSSLFEIGYPALVPTNEPLSMAYQINKIIHEKEYSSELSKKNHSVSMVRHDQGKIKDDLISAYKDIVSRR